MPIAREMGWEKSDRLEGSEIKRNEKLMRIMPLARLVFLYRPREIRITRESASSEFEGINVCESYSHRVRLSRYVSAIKNLFNPPGFRYSSFISRIYTGQGFNLKRSCNRNYFQDAV